MGLRGNFLLARKQIVKTEGSISEITGDEVRDVIDKLENYCSPDEDLIV